MNDYRSFLYISIRQPLQRDTLRDLHQDTNYVLSDTQQTTRISLRRRNDYPGTFCHRIAAEIFSLGYGDPSRRSIEDEFLIIDVDTSAGTIRIERDAFCTLPIYFAIQDGKLVVSNKYDAVANALQKVSVSKEGLQHFFTRCHYNNHTFLHEVRVLREREVLLFDRDGRLTIQQPAPRPWIGSAAAPIQDAAHFQQVFSAHLRYFYQTRLHNQQFACEISGGLDSSTLPLFLSREGIRKFPLAAQVFSGDFTATQLPKLNAIADQVQGPDIHEYIKPMQDFPLRSLLGENPVPFFARDPYIECNHRVAQRLQQQGVKVLATGHGGDEVFENAPQTSDVGFGESERMERATHPRPPFMTDLFYKDYIQASPDTPERSMPLHSGAFLAGRSYSNKFIDYDIWPVTPFASPGLYAFCQGLPLHFRVSKNVLRIFFAAHNFPKIIYNPVQNENYGGPFEAAVQAGAYDSLMDRLVRNSVTIRLGYVDQARLLRFYHTLKSGQAFEQAYPDSTPVCLQVWMQAELSLEATANLTERLPA